MRVRRERTLEELYGATERILEPKITPVLQGIYRIQGPVDECEDETQTMNLGVFPVGERSGPVNQNLLKKPETGTCNVCSAPCSSCFHFNQDFSLMESKLESGPTASTSGRKEEDNCSSVGANEPVCKRKACDDSHYASSEASNISTSTSGHDACLENNETITTLQGSFPCEPDQHGDKATRISSEEADENDELLTEQKNTTPHNPFPSKSCKPSNVPQNTLSNLVEEEDSLEQRRDKISCSSEVKDAAVNEDGPDMDKKDTAKRIASTDSLFVNKAEKVVPKEGAVDYHKQEIEQTQVGLARPTSCNEESLQQKSPGASFPDASSSHKSELADLPPSKSNPSPKACFPSSNSQSEYSFHQVDPNGLARTASSELRADVPESSMQNEELPVAGKSASTIGGGQNSGASLKCEVSEACVMNEPLASFRSAHAYFGAEIGDSKVLSDEVRDWDFTKQQSDISNSLVEASSMQVSDIQQQAVSEGGNSGEIEDDVKVCDICGDAGQEELLAICSRCSDGAEHTYCMRTRLDEVPEGDWLCEECQLKEESEKHKPDHSQAGIGASEAPTSSGKSEKSASTINSNGLNTAKNTTNLLQSTHISTKMNEENQEATSQSSQKFYEPSARSTEVASPKKKIILSHESSSSNLDVGRLKSLNNSDAGKLKQASALLGGQSANSLQTFARPQTSSASNPSKTQVPQLRGALSKSISFNNSKVPKVKQLIDDVPQKQKHVKESTSTTIIRKEGQDKTITKSASFRSVNSCSYGESVNKTKLVIPSQGEEPRCLKQVKERSLLNKKGTSLLDRPSISLSPRVGNSILSPKADVEVDQKDAKVNNTPDLSNLGISQGSNNGNTPGRNELKKPYLFKASESTLSNGLCKPIYQKSGQLASKEKACTTSGSADRSCGNHDSFLQKTHQTSESSHQDIKVKDPPRLIGSRQAASGSSRILRCQKCNEAGHATQFCAVDKLRMSALKPFAERNLKEGGSKSSKWKDAADMVSSRARKAGIRSPDQSEEVSTSSLDQNCEVTSKDHLSNSSSGGRNSPSLDVIVDGQDLRNSYADHSKSLALKQVKQKNRQQGEAICVSREPDVDALYNISDESKLKMPILSNQASLLADHLRASIIPQLEYIWQGGFEVLRAGRPPELCDGVQAHLSSCVSPKVLEAVIKFSSKVQLEEVSRRSSWPPQFQENAPKEDNIALFFFAKDIESYEKNYNKLLENMLKNDLALIGNIDTVELLVFPSKLLPENSQRWNKLYFLWGVFRGRRKNSLKDIPDLQEKPCETNLNKDLTIPGLPSSVTFSGISSSQDLNYCESLDKEISGCEVLPKGKVLKPTTQSDFLDKPYPEVGDRIRDKKFSTPKSLLEPAVDENIVSKCDKLSKEKMHKWTALEKEETSHSEETLHPSAADDKLPEDQIPSLFPISGSSNNTSHLPNFLTCLSKHRLDTKQLPSEIKSDMACLNNITRNSDEDNIQNAPHDDVHMGGKDRVIPMYLASLNHVQGNQSIMEEKAKWKESIVKNEVVLDEWPENLMDTTHRTGELRPSRKRVHSSSMELPSHLSGGTSKSNGENVQWKGITDCTSVYNREEHKKMKFENGGDTYCSPREEIFDGRTSSKIHPLSSCFVDGSINDETMVDSSTSSGRYFSQDLGPARNKVPEIFIDLISSDEESPNDSPDLELALGDNKKSPKKGILPLFTPNIGEKSERDKPPLNDGSDLTGPLSLSLAFPTSDELQEVKPTLKTEKLLPEKPLVNTSLFLFGGFKDT
ncbi:uncharacterized protein [Typha latifolia]|uniref:uncharacterized protein isoform X2 n=1 Tax=Typha latifolia TaxID=4733 RepID=UPI003C2E1839